MDQKLITFALFGAIALPFAAYAETASLDEVVVTASRFRDDVRQQPITVSIISRDAIRQSAARTLPELLAEQAGIGMRDLFGNNAASSAVDIRGFGAAAVQNTLVLLDGRRITDPDLSGVQWAAIPFSAIERIEVLRGSGTVLYGDGATGGVINIITRTPTQLSAQGEMSVRGGSFSSGEAQFNGSYFSGVWGVDVTASKLESRGYRDNNHNNQSNAQANFSWLGEAGNVALKLSLDRQAIRLPGARTVQPALGIDQVASNPRGTSTPLDYASRDGNQVALEWEHNIAGMDINLGLAQRDKNQKANFDFGGFPNYSDADLKVSSFTPRVRIPHGAGGQSTLVMGVDVHRWDYAKSLSNSPANIARPHNRIAMKQDNRAVYLQNTAQLSPATALLAGLRHERVSMSGNDIFDAGAPGGAFGSGAPAASFAASEQAYDLALRHQLDSGVIARGKIGRSFRFANVDEIYESDAAFTNQFQFLRPQTVDGIELGMERQMQSANWHATLFRNKVNDEIHLDPFSAGIGNTNLPPSRRQGVEFGGRWQALPQLSLNANYAYTDARFLSGVWAGNRVPLVAARKSNLGASWMLSEKTRLNTLLTYVGSQFMENDEPNTLGFKIPAYALLDVKLTHEAQGWRFSASVNNLLDRDYFNYAISSQFTAGKYSAYPLPGRTVFVELSRQM